MHERVLQPVERVSLRDRVYAQLLDAIVAGAIPPGSRLRDRDLAAELGVSRTPVREALQRLEAEGLVQTMPGALTRVAPLDVRDAREAVPVIAALHAAATRAAVGRLASPDVGVLRLANTSFASALAAQDTLAALAADDAFHEVFVRVAANGELRRTLERLTPRVRRLELARFRSLLGRESAHQHDAIIAAAVRGEAARAASLVEENWLSLGRLLAGTFESVNEEGDSDDHDRDD